MRNIIVEMSHKLLDLLITKDDVVIDATMGNGFDTLYLAEKAKYVYAFDIQESALRTTLEKLNEHHVENVKLLLDSHENIYYYVSDFKGVIFNLGYLPRGDHSITTDASVTEKTLKMLLQQMKKDQFILYVIYPGHEEGMKESKLINHILSTVNHKHFKILRIDLPYQDNHPPYIKLIMKEKDDILI